jgi:hypothetical protein
MPEFGVVLTCSDRAMGVVVHPGSKGAASQLCLECVGGVAYLCIVWWQSITKQQPCSADVLAAASAC